jgi:hypothetical protein
VDGPSGRAARFEKGDEVIVNWSTLPLPLVKWIEVNGRDCGGRFGVQARTETDLLLTLIDDGCVVVVLGSHPEGGTHVAPGE